METLRASCTPSLNLTTIKNTNQAVFLSKPISNFSFKTIPCSPFLSIQKPTSRTKFISTITSVLSTETENPVETEIETESPDEKFDWFSQWYPIMPVCDLDKRKPTAKKVMGIDVVVWFDRNENAWKVFDDSCPHRLAPLSEGRIDQWGRLQCVYHGWCFNGSGDCKFIPQAPPDGPPVFSLGKIAQFFTLAIATFKKACVSVYPSTVQNDIVWFWPNTDPKYKDILQDKKPPYIPELDDPSYTKLMTNRDIPYGYEVLIENLMDPAHVPYAHYGIMRVPSPKGRPKLDREGGAPLDINVATVAIDGFSGKQSFGNNRFIPPCVYYSSPNMLAGQSEVGKDSLPGAAKRKVLLVFICIPVSPGKSRLIWTFPRNFGLWIDRIVPRWMFHIAGNLVLDSDMYLLHVEERRILDVGQSNWQKACFLPTKSDANVIAFRKWLNKYSDGQVNWGIKFTGDLPPSPPREKLMDRYWSHVVNCTSCGAAYKGLNVLEAVLKVVSIATIGIVAATKPNMMSMAVRTTLVTLAILCFMASKWLSHFIYKNFHFHDYNHALR